MTHVRCKKEEDKLFAILAFLICTNRAPKRIVLLNKAFVVNLQIHSNKIVPTKNCSFKTNKIWNRASVVSKSAVSSTKTSFLKAKY